MALSAVVAAPFRAATELGYVLDAIELSTMLADLAGDGKVTFCTTTPDPQAGPPGRVAMEARWESLVTTARRWEEAKKAEQGYGEHVANMAKKAAESAVDITNLDAVIGAEITRATPGDSVVFAYVDHGENSRIELAPGAYLTQAHIKAHAAAAKAKRVKLTIILLCCHSASILGDAISDCDGFLVDDGNNQGNSRNYSFDGWKEYRCGTLSAVRLAESWFKGCEVGAAYSQNLTVSSQPVCYNLTNRKLRASFPRRIADTMVESTGRNDQDLEDDFGSGERGVLKRFVKDLGRSTALAEWKSLSPEDANAFMQREGSVALAQEWGDLLKSKGLVDREYPGGVWPTSLAYVCGRVGLD